MTSPSAHGAPRSGLVATLSRPVIVVLVIALPLLLAGLFASFSGNDVVPLASQSSSETTTSADGSEGTDGGTPAAGDPLAKTRSALTQTQLPLSLLSGGLTQLTDAAPQLTDGVTQLSDGLGQARSGSQQLADGNSQLAGGLVQLQGGVGQLGDGAVQISGGVNQLTTPLLALGEKQAQVTSSIADVANRIEVLNNPITTDAARQLRELIDTLNAQGIGPDTVSQINQLRDGAALLAFQLDDPSSEFVTGVNTAVDGSALLSTGAGQLNDGIIQLDDGGKQLKAGTDQITTGIEPIGGVVSSLQTNVKTAQTSLPAANAVAATTTTDENGQTQTTLVVQGSTPSNYYLIAALVAVAAAAAVSLMRLLTRRDRVARIAPVLGALAVTAAAGIAYWFVGDGLSFGSLLGGIVFLFLGSAAFLAAAGAVQMAFGRAVGQSINLVLLLVQLVLAGGALVGSPDSSVFGKAAAFTPVGWLAAGLERIAADAMDSTGWLAVLVMVALLAVSGLVYSLVARSDPEDDRAAYRDEPRLA
ncbi:phage infection protein [Rhodococcus sp. SORGH_AS_0301]|uniref:phage infection protein n=1 Tax=Rhodococcus sp. SORGH_AS_0301 TaxID=3041780 RepID=UPI00277D6D28|nr:phage infection protein [Rhodococcus sp. SORGH_AS_0301]MDQ1182506.1 putative membrane protein [Rhodococcus sp. SORGH_AS_0301]